MALKHVLSETDECKSGKVYCGGWKCLEIKYILYMDLCIMLKSIFDICPCQHTNVTSCLSLFIPIQVRMVSHCHLATVIKMASYGKKTF